MQPSDLVRIRLYDSVFRKSECEVVAHNIIVILERTGNTWRALDWKEYEAERLKDGNFTPRERPYFENVIDYCVSEQTARLFSPAWKL